jgi:hypothetical protein
VQEVMFKILPLTIASDITQDGDRVLLECEFGTNSDSALATEILTIIKNE